MDGLTYDLFVGVIGGILTAAAFLMWQKIISPKVRSWRYQVPNIDNTAWDGFSSGDGSIEQPTSRLSVSQFGDKITASVERRTSNGIRKFNYRGMMRAGQIVLTWEEPAGRGYVCGAMVLRLSSNMRTMSGLSVYEDLETAKVVSEERIYRRVG